MKNTKTKSLLFVGLLAIAMVFSLMFGFGVLNTKVTHADPPVLPQLTNVQENEGVVTWDAFTGAHSTYWGYYVEIEEIGWSDILYINSSYEEYITDPDDIKIRLEDELCIAHAETGAYTWKVTAVNLDDEEGVDFDDEASQTATGTYNFVNTQEALAAPTNLRVTGATIAWDAVEGAGSYRYQVYKDGVAMTSVRGTINTTSKQLIYSFDVGHEYYFTVQARSDDAIHTHSALATSETFSFEPVAKITNLKIQTNHPDFDFAHMVLTFDGFEEGQVYKVHVYISQNGERVTDSYQSLPYDITYYHGAAINALANKTVDVEITAYDENYVPLAKYTITGWNSWQEYTQPEEPVQTGLSAGAVAGIVIASVAVAGAAGFCTYWFVFRKKKVA